MDRQTHSWTDGQTYRLHDRWTDEWKDNWTDGWINRQTYRWIKRWTDRTMTQLMDRWTDRRLQILLKRWLNSWTDGQTDRLISTHLILMGALRIVYIGGIHQRNCRRQRQLTVLALATLGDSTKKKKQSYLLSCHPRTVACCCRGHYRARFCQCKHSFKYQFLKAFYRQEFEPSTSRTQCLSLTSMPGVQNWVSTYVFTTI